MSEIISIESRRRRCAPAQHGSRRTSSSAQHGLREEPILDAICRRVGPGGYVVVDGRGRVVDLHDPKGFV